MPAKRSLSVKNTRITILLTLLIMVLMRLVWMQLRTYEISYEPATVSHLCALPRKVCRHLAIEPSQPPSPASALMQLVQSIPTEFSISSTDMSIANMAFLVMTIFLLTGFVRILTSSWIWAIATAAMLLSRGRLIASMGYIGQQHAIMFGAAILATSACVVLRTRRHLRSHLLSNSILCGLHPSFFGTLAVIPILWLLLKRRQSAPLDQATVSLSDIFTSGSSNLISNVPKKLLRTRQILWITVISLLAIGLTLPYLWPTDNGIAFMLTPWGQLPQSEDIPLPYWSWLKKLLSSVDLDLLLAGSIVLVGSLVPAAHYRSNFRWQTLLISSLYICSFCLMNVALFYYDRSVPSDTVHSVRPEDLMPALEPTIFAMVPAALLQLINFPRSISTAPNHFASNFNRS